MPSASVKDHGRSVADRCPCCYHRQCCPVKPTREPGELKRVVAVCAAKTIMLVGDTGIGKSSVGDRLLGYDPTKGKGPFEVVHGCTSGTFNVDKGVGNWLGDPNNGMLVVVDTPGRRLQAFGSGDS